jgi:hypothetical protein
MRGPPDGDAEMLASPCDPILALPAIVEVPYHARTRYPDT